MKLFNLFIVLTLILFIGKSDKTCWNTRVDVHMYDTKGNGWGQNTMRIRNVNGDSMKEFKLGGGYQGSDTHDLDYCESECFDFECDGMGSNYEDLRYQVSYRGGLWKGQCPETKRKCMSSPSCNSYANLSMHMYDDYGDGWNGDYVTITNKETEQDLKAFTIMYGSEYVQDYELNYCPGQCYKIHCGQEQGEYPQDIYWELKKDGNIIVQGGCPDEYYYCIPDDDDDDDDDDDYYQCPQKTCDYCKQGHCDWVYNDYACCEYECSECLEGYTQDPENPKHCIEYQECGVDHLTIEMNDSYGDSWIDDYLRFTDKNTQQEVYTAYFPCTGNTPCEGEITGDYQKMAYYDLEYCSPQCFEVHCDGVGNWPEDISWKVYNSNNQKIAEGYCPDSQEICY